MHLTYSVVILLSYNNFSTKNVYVIFFWLVGNIFVIDCLDEDVQDGKK